MPERNPRTLTLNLPAFFARTGKGNSLSAWSGASVPSSPLSLNLKSTLKILKVKFLFKETLTTIPINNFSFNENFTKETIINLNSNNFINSTINNLNNTQITTESSSSTFFEYPSVGQCQFSALYQTVFNGARLLKRLLVDT